MSKKLTMVSVAAKGKRLTKFVFLPVDVDGKVRISVQALNTMLDELGVRSRGETFTIG